ncbi:MULTISPECIES: STM3941 family protein [unclassified Sphingobacterium]|uniref:STM3941 family protein n=1 Tax=unclassified Sphingobacterium TaxID=2609468 RepID=UPI0025E72F06|nr:MULTISPECIES: STM3941 family protein [unclassified Sphingobacterium]
MKETHLYRNKRKTTQMLLISAVFCLLLFIILLYSTGLFDGVFKAKPTIFSAGVLLVLLILLIVNLLSLRDNSAQIVLSEKYFFGKTTPLAKAFGQGNWQDVKSIDLEKVGGDTMIIVTLKNSGKYKDRLPSLLWKMAYQESAQELNIMYSASTIDLEPSELHQLFLSYWNKQK